MTIFVGILLGIIVGSINLGFDMKLGLAGGPLVVAILLSRFGYKAKLVTYTSTSASMMLRELGICLFLASVGISAGKDFAASVFNETGMWWVIWGFIITIVPLIIVGSIARGHDKINYQLSVHHGSYVGFLHRPPCTGLCQQQHRQRCSCRGILNGGPAHNVPARGIGPGTDSLPCIRVCLLLNQINK